jgi:hypothetical protein
MSTEKTLFEKDPDEIGDFPWDWGPWVARGPDGDALTGSPVVTFVDPPDASLTLERPAERVGDVVTVWLEGGTAGKDYRVRCEVGTTSGRVGVRTSTVEVRNR